MSEKKTFALCIYSDCVVDRRICSKFSKFRSLWFLKKRAAPFHNPPIELRAVKHTNRFPNEIVQSPKAAEF